MRCKRRLVLISAVLTGREESGRHAGSRKGQGWERECGRFRSWTILVRWETTALVLVIILGWVWGGVCADWLCSSMSFWSGKSNCNPNTCMYIPTVLGFMPEQHCLHLSMFKIISWPKISSLPNYASSCVFLDTSEMFKSIKALRWQKRGKGNDYHSRCFYIPLELEPIQS